MSFRFFSRKNPFLTRGFETFLDPSLARIFLPDYLGRGREYILPSRRHVRRPGGFQGFLEHIFPWPPQREVVGGGGGMGRDVWLRVFSRKNNPFGGFSRSFKPIGGVGGGFWTIFPSKISNIYVF